MSYYGTLFKVSQSGTRNSELGTNMALQIFLNATLRLHVAGYNPYEGISLEVPSGTTVAQVVAQLGLPANEVSLIMVDGRRQSPDFPLQGDERLGLFPPIGGG